MNTLNLPSWASVDSDGSDKFAVTILVDSAAAYTEWLTELGVDEPTQFDIECAYQCIKMDVQRAVEGTEYDPRTAGKSHVIKFSRAEEFALANFPEGKGVGAATQGLQARNAYRKARGAVPFSA
jgi:hypothetical protein